MEVPSVMFGSIYVSIFSMTVVTFVTENVYTCSCPKEVVFIIHT